MGFCRDVLGDEERAFVGIVADEGVFAVDSFPEELPRGEVLDEDSVGHGEEGPGAVIAGAGDLGAGRLEGCCVFGEEALEDCFGDSTVGCAVRTADRGGERVVGL